MDGARRWLLLEAGRNRLAALLVGLVFVSLVAAGCFGMLDVAEPAAVARIAGGLVPGLFAFLSIVLAINQLVLSQEFGSAAEVRRRVRRIRDFRRDVEEVADEAPSPVLPTAFLGLIVQAIETKAARLADRSEELPSDVGGSLGGVFEDVAERASRSRAQLADSEPGRVSAILAVLDYDDAVQLQQIREALAEHGSQLGADGRQALEELEELLELFSVARTHFRTNYTQRVLARLSRLLLYVGVPAILAAFALALLPGAHDPTLRLVLVSALLSLAFAPVAVLSSYVLRIATVSERTLAAGPFESRPG